MHYEYLLYARSRLKDYRWMLLPSGSTTTHWGTAYALYTIYEKLKRHTIYHHAPLAPLFCIEDQHGILLFRFGLIGQEDAYGRPIYGLAGIRIQQAERRLFRQALPYMLKNHAALLNPFKKLDFEQSDRWIQSPSPTYTLTPASWRGKSPQTTRTFQPTSPSTSIQLAYNQTGLQHLIALFETPDFPLVDFAFGAVPKMLAAHASFKVIASAVL